MDFTWGEMDNKPSNAWLAYLFFNCNYECYEGKVQNAVTAFNEHPT